MDAWYATQRGCFQMDLEQQQLVHHPCLVVCRLCCAKMTFEREVAYVLNSEEIQDLVDMSSIGSVISAFSLSVGANSGCQSCGSS